MADDDFTAVRQSISSGQDDAVGRHQWTEDFHTVCRTVACLDRHPDGGAVVNKFHNPIGGKRFIALHGGFGEEHFQLFIPVDAYDCLQAHPFG